MISAMEVIYDGLGLEDEAVGPVLHPACSACAEPLTLVVRRVLDLTPLRPSDSHAADVAHQFSLVRKGSGEWTTLVTGLGLTPYVVDVDCPGCGEGHRAVVGYGEYQPARYIGVLQGIARR